MSNVIDRLEALAAASRIGRLRHVPGMLKHYVASEPCDEWGNAPDEADFAGFSIQEMHPRDGREVPAEAQAQHIVGAVNALPDLLKLARAASEEHLKRPCRDLRCQVCVIAQELFREAQP